MPFSGQFTGTDNSVEKSWLIEMDDDGAPISQLAFLPIETMPDVAPDSPIGLLIGDHTGIVFTDAAANPARIAMLRYLAELQRRQAEN